MCRKNSGSQPIPFDLRCGYERPPSDFVPKQARVQPPNDKAHKSLKTITTIPDAIEYYLALFSQQFESDDGLRKKRRYLYKFLDHLESQEHPLLLADITLEDAKNFILSLNDEGISYRIRKRYAGGLRTWSRLLFNAGILPCDVFVSLDMEQ